MAKRPYGIIGHVNGSKLALAAALMMVGTVAPRAIVDQDMGKMMDRRITAMDNQFPCYDGKRGSKRTKKEKLYKNPKTRWRV